VLIVGHNYTRDEIAQELGGSTIEFLPSVNGRVVCACLRTDLNPDAPRIILPGHGPQIQASAESLCAQHGAIRVFIKRRVNAWEYVGDFEVERFSLDSQEITKQETHAQRSGEQGISRIIYMKEVLRP
jgi:hypothetical protein